MLKVKKLHPEAKLPTVATPGEDLGFDLYSVEDVAIPAGSMRRVKNGIAVEFAAFGHGNYGLLIRDRSSIASKGVIVSAGVIDAGYRGEMMVLMTNLGKHTYYVKKGDKIAQMIPMPVLTTRGVVEVEELSQAVRGEKGFGSSGT